MPIGNDDGLTAVPERREPPDPEPRRSTHPLATVPDAASRGPPAVAKSGRANPDQNPGGWFHHTRLLTANAKVPTPSAGPLASSASDRVESIVERGEERGPIRPGGGGRVAAELPPTAAACRA